ncbi:MAG: uracil-DNA glycosylase [Actinobacteria bacterium]|nr:uracil-DNA glycosylase [Actinomycetota bacterium]
MSDSSRRLSAAGTGAPWLEPRRTWRELERDAASCTGCALHGDRTKVVFGAGDPEADLLIIGEAPGRPDDLQGKPYLGALGNLLDSLLSEVGYARDQVYVTTAVKCHPSGNRSANPEQLRACVPYLLEQIGHLRPCVILTLGEPVTRLLLRRDIPLSQVAGYRLDVFETTLIPTFSLNDALRGSQPALNGLRRDFHAARAVIDGELPGGAETAALAREQLAGRDS